MTASPRKSRCRVLDQFDNRCQSEAVTDFRFCAHHLAAAAEEFRRVVEERGEGGGNGR
ncbi:MAG TPA: hypothetical protein VHZ03_05365 [Trebonia sp.]|nr:hypothetical protein [Trebonia sp.]